MGLSGETVGSDLLKSDSVKFRLWWLNNKISALISHHPAVEGQTLCTVRTVMTVVTVVTVVTFLTVVTVVTAVRFP